MKTIKEYQVWDFTGKVCVFLKLEDAFRFCGNKTFKGKPIFTIRTKTTTVKEYETYLNH